MTASTSPQSGGIQVRRVHLAYQQVADQLRALILSGDLAPGDRLPSETELTTMFGVSRSTVREALRALTSRDLVVTTRGATGGTFVSRVRGSQVSDYLEASLGLMSGDGLTVEEILVVRELLEVPAAGMAATKRTQDDLLRLKEILVGEEQSRVRGVQFTEHRQFHGFVVAAAGNGLLEVVMEPVFGVLQGRFTKPGLQSSVWHEIDADHRRIAGEIASGDAAAAEEAMRAHLHRLREIYVS